MVSSQPVRQEFMENECEALPGVAYPRVRDNRSTLNTKTGYDDDVPTHGGTAQDELTWVAGLARRWFTTQALTVPDVQQLRRVDDRDQCITTEPNCQS